MTGGTRPWIYFSASISGGRDDAPRYAALIAALALSTPATTQSFVNFESPQTHPVAIADDGSRLYVVNTPDNRVAVFSLLVAGQAPANGSRAQGG